MRPERLEAIVFVALLSAAGSRIVHSQTLNPVTWTARSPAPAAAGSVRHVSVVAHIARGWHVYSLTQPEGGPTPLTITLADGQSATVAGEVRGPKPRVERQPAFDVPVELYDGNAEFVVPIKAPANAEKGSNTLKLVARWQACSDSVCLPPRSEEISVEIARTAAASSGAQTAVLPLRWDAVIQYDSLTLPFPLEIRQTGSSVRVAFFNGDDPVVSTSGRRVRDSIFVAFDHLAMALRGRISGTTLTASYGSTTGRGLHDVVAHPHKAATTSSRNVPSIAGTWYIPARSSKGEQAWRFVVRQNGSRAVATILRVDGDAGAHVGEWRDGRFILNHFDGARPSQIEIVPSDSGLIVTVNGVRGRGKPLAAFRPDVAIARGLPLPADFMTHTRMKDSTEAFRFSFPNLDGRVVSNTDTTFAQKVVIVAIGGTWCPNCHDEAPFLTELYRRYRSRGLEIVALDFEDSLQLRSLDRPRAFVKKYEISYPFLIAGTQAELHEKVAQADSLDSWPTTFFIGRDGRVRAIHAGFAARASGEFHTQLVADYTAMVERLLREPVAARANQESRYP